ncbi:MAG: chemotaxis protein CheC [Planctomycetota bacterium]
MTIATDPNLAIALRTVAVNGSYNASRAMSKWLRRGVRLTSEGFKTVPIAEASATLGQPDDPIAAIHLPLAGDVSGDMLLTFPESVALRLAEIIMQAPEGSAETLGELEQSCLQETGNIVASAYANSLAKWLKLTIEPAAPTFCHDMVCSVIDPVLSEQARYHDDLLMAVTEFLLDARRMQWGMLLLPSEASWHLIEERCRLDAFRQNALQTIAVNGAFNASRAMSKWLKRGVKLTTEGFERLPLDGLAAKFDESKPVVAMRTSLTDQMHGCSLLVMKEEHACRLADLLLGQPIGTADLSGELEQSALQETTNIVASAFVNSLSTWLDIVIRPGAPEFALDLPAALCESVLAEQAMVSDEVFAARTDFLLDEQWAEWEFVLLPSPSALRLIESSCR